LVEDLFKTNIKFNYTGIFSIIFEIVTENYWSNFIKAYQNYLEYSGEKFDHSLLYPKLSFGTDWNFMIYLYTSINYAQLQTNNDNKKIIRLGVSNDNQIIINNVPTLNDNKIRLYSSKFMNQQNKPIDVASLYGLMKKMLCADLYLRPDFEDIKKQLKIILKLD